MPSGLTVYLRCGPAIVTASLETVREMCVNYARCVITVPSEKDIDSRRTGNIPVNCFASSQVVIGSVADIRIGSRCDATRCGAAWRGAMQRDATLLRKTAARIWKWINGEDGGVLDDVE